MASEIKVDTISEKTSAGGVTIDGLLIKDGGISGDVSLIGTTPTFTIGDAGAEDAALVFDGNAQDYYIALDDSADDLVIGLGSTVGTTPAISIDENLAIKTYGDITMTGTTPVLTIGDAGAEDTAIVFDGNAQDYHIGLDDSADTLVLGLGSTLGTTPAMTVNSSQVVTFAQNPVFPDGGVAVADLDIDGATDIGAAIVDADLFIIDDGAGGTNRKTAASRLKTYVGGGITQADQWIINSTITEDVGYLTANWVQYTGAGGQIGSALTQSSGVFTFPSTGYYLIDYLISARSASSNYFFTAVYASLHFTTDNSSYTDLANAMFSVPQSASTNVYSNGAGSGIIDCTDTSQVKFQFRINAYAGASQQDIVVQGTSSGMYTGFSCIRLGDT